MKNALLLSLIFSISTLHADVVLNDNGTVTKNGASLNNASDALLNKHITSVEFLAALQAKLSASSAAASKAQSDLAALQAQMQAQLDGDLKALQTALASATIATDRAVISGKIELVQSYIAAAFKSTDQLKAESLASEIEAKQAELEKLQTEQLK